MSDFVPQTRDNEKENIGQQLPFLQMPSVLSMFVPVYFTEVFLFTALTQQITPLTLPLLFFSCWPSCYRSGMQQIFPVGETA